MKNMYAILTQILFFSGKRLHQLLYTLLLSFITFVAFSQVSGTVFQDFNANGIKDNIPISTAGDGSILPAMIDVGVAGITVTAYSASGTLAGTAVTAANGSYSITGGTGPYRVEFTLPSYYFASNGNVSNTTVQFVAAGGTANLGVNSPEDYVGDTNPYLATVMYINGTYNNATSGPCPSFLTFKYAANSGIPKEKGNENQLGATWGLAYKRTTKTMFIGATLRRFVGFGPLGPGGIYSADMSDPNTNTGITNYINVNTIGIPVGTDMRDASTCNSVAVDVSQPSHDEAGGKLVGQFGLGGIEYDESRNTLWLVNLTDRKLYGIKNISASTPVAADVIGGYSITLPTPLQYGELRPWAVKAYRGFIYIGTIADYSYARYGDPNEFNAYVLKFDPSNPSAGFSIVTSFPLEYVRGRDSPDQTQYFGSWGAPFLPGNDWMSYAGNQPLLSDIEFDVDGSIVVGLMDKSASQRGYNQYNSPFCTDTGIGSGGNTTGDIVRLCKSGNSYIVGGNAGCNTTIPASYQIVDPDNGNAVIQEYYWGDEGPTAGQVSAFNESALGALAFLPGSGQVMGTNIDPQTLEANGVITYNNTTGGDVNRYNVYSSSTANTFGKTNGIGDIELMGQVPPIEIGNRVWNDTDKDGIQDGDELGISGVIVTLCLASAPNTAIGTATTDVNGNYYFSSATGTSTASAIYGLSLSFGTAYILKSPTTTGDKSLTTKDLGANDLADSDADAAGKIAFTTGTAGQNNHTFDWGIKEQLAPNPMREQTKP